ncbi:hypothetical protein DMENIID0001_015880 [Sergentomyia squamirostris]
MQSQFSTNWCSKLFCRLEEIEIRTRMRNSGRIKCLILSLSLLAFIYLLVFNFSTPADHKEFQEYLMKLRKISDNLAKNGWDEMISDRWKKHLEIDDHATMEGECKFENVVIALPGESLEENLWEYLSLLVIRNQWKSEKDYTLQVFLAPKTYRELSKILDRVHVNSIETYPPKCLDFRHAKILGHVNPLEPVRIPSSPQLFIVEKGGKRYKDLVKTDLNALRKSFILNRELVEKSQSRMLELRSTFQKNISGSTKENVFIVALHFGLSRVDVGVPQDFYKSSIKAASHLHKKVGVLLICPDDKLKFCKEEFPEDKNLKIIPASGDSEDFALLNLCDGNILHSNLGFLAAILNGGETSVFYRTSAKDYDPAIFVAKKKRKWFLVKK